MSEGQLGFEDGGSMVLHNPQGRGRIPYCRYKLSKEYREKQMYKPQLDTRNPQGTAVKRWDAYGGTFVEMRGTRSWFGQCGCGCWIYSARDASTPEFRGRGNTGPKGRPPMYCHGCREQRREERANEARRGMARLRRDPSSRKRDFEFRERL